MYSFLRRPLWIISHVLIAALIVVLISLGFWQRSRYFEERGEKDRIESAAAADPVPLDSVVQSNLGFSKVPDSALYRHVSVSGTYDTANEVVINNRSLDGSPGAWILTPLITDDGMAVAVVRGWIPLEMSSSKVPVPDAAPPTGRVTVAGLVQRTQVRESIGPIDPAEGKLSHLSRVDLARLESQLPYGLKPAWILLDSQNPLQSGQLPQKVSLQPNDPSQNFSYMMQWWIFAAIAIIGYPLVIRMVARNKESGGSVKRKRDRGDDEIPWAEGLGPDGRSTP
ncbi:MAG: SURF1 family protein [Microthrixaceae bacterium]